MKKKIKALINTMKDNSGDTNIQKLILILIAFVAGGLLVTAIIFALGAHYGSGTGNMINDIMG